ncbi:MAG: hypothetical protein ABI986_03945 [Chloroflexota bacterium]
MAIDNTKLYDERIIAAISSCEKTMRKDKARQLANILSVVFALTINTLANVLPLNGQHTGETSARFHVFFVPAG